MTISKSNSNDENAVVVLTKNKIIGQGSFCSPHVKRIRATQFSPIPAGLGFYTNNFRSSSSTSS